MARFVRLNPDQRRRLDEAYVTLTADTDRAPSVRALLAEAHTSADAAAAYLREKRESLAESLEIPDVPDAPELTQEVARGVLEAVWPIIWPVAKERAAAELNMIRNQVADLEVARIDAEARALRAEEEVAQATAQIAKARDQLSRLAEPKK